MKYPVSLSQKLEKVEQTFLSWNSSLRFEEVVNWILQFDSDDYDLAIRVIENINFLNYSNVKSALNIAYSKLARKAIERNTKIDVKNTLFAGLGDFGKSGSMMSYNFRIINELSEENFLENEDLISSGKIENIVLIDDILSTGNQSLKEIEKLTIKVTPYGVKNIFLLTVCGMKNGIAKIDEETKAYSFSAFEYGTKDTISDLDGDFYDGLNYEERELLQKRIESYGKIANPSNPLGYGAIGGLIAFDFNTPNTSLPIIWGNANSWIPLFKRTQRISGIQSYYKKFESKTNAKKNEEKIEDKSILSIFVEGKTEETFFDILLKQKDLSTNLSYDKINIIALGGTLGYKRLVNQLSVLPGDKVIILEDDKNTRHLSKKYEDAKIPVFFLEPNVMSLIDIKSLLEDDRYYNKVVEYVIGNEVTDHSYFELEMILLGKSSLSSRSKTIWNLVSNYLDNKKFQTFLAKLKAVLEK